MVEAKKKIVKKPKTFPDSPLKIGTKKAEPNPKAQLAKHKKIMLQTMADHYKTYQELMAAVPSK